MSLFATQPAAGGVEAINSAGPLIVFDHVGIGFDGRTILDDVSFSLERGQTLCILGRSGVGKSVTLRMLMGFLEPDFGSVRVEGRDLATLGEEGMRELRKRLTMVFQNGALFDSLSVRENVAFPLRERGDLAEEAVLAEADRLIALVGAEDVLDELPSSLSTGRKRAVAIARALALAPEIVLYDEPTTMVDPMIARRMGALIDRLKSTMGLTSLVVTHDLRFAEKLADRILFLHQGKALFFGETKDFLSSGEKEIVEFCNLDKYRLPIISSNKKA